MKSVRQVSIARCLCHRFSAHQGACQGQKAPSELSKEDSEAQTLWRQSRGASQLSQEAQTALARSQLLQHVLTAVQSHHQHGCLGGGPGRPAGPWRCLPACAQQQHGAQSLAARLAHLAAVPRRGCAALGASHRRFHLGCAGLDAQRHVVPGRFLGGPYPRAHRIASRRGQGQVTRLARKSWNTHLGAWTLHDLSTCTYRLCVVLEKTLTLGMKSADGVRVCTDTPASLGQAPLCQVGVGLNHISQHTSQHTGQTRPCWGQAPFPDGAGSPLSQLPGPFLPCTKQPVPLPLTFPALGSLC